MHQRGFTLVELLFVIAIISLLASLGLANMNVARAKSIDTAKRAEIATIRTALRSFHLDRGRMPHNYNCAGASCTPGARATLAIEDTNNPENPQTESGKAYRASMLELVEGKYLSKVPKSPGGAGYVYYDYGPSSSAGAVIGTDLAQAEPSTTGEPGTCRPFDALAQTEPEPVSQLASPLGDWIACMFEEDGVFFERACVEGGEDEEEDNFCSSASSSNYCLCNRY